MIVSYEWLKDYLGSTTLTPEQIETLLTFHAFEIEGRTAVGADEAIDIKVLPNRGSDCLSHRGIARELSSITGTPLNYDPLMHAPDLPHTDTIAVTIADTNACLRFSAALVEGVTVGESPAWLKDRLATLGQRSINNIVDATNYVMYALGQPLHAYDADLFPQTDGKWHFGVRFGQPGEEVHLLAEGGKQEERIVTCVGTELLIVDTSRNVPIGLAGVKGGSYAGVHAGTKNIIIEAAHFDPVVTRKTARRLGIVIDASKRFENRPAPELTLYALRDCAELIAKIAGGVLRGAVDVYPEPRTIDSVLVRPERVNALLGLALNPETISEVLVRAGVTIESTKDGLLCRPPFERTDLLLEVDFIEEIARLYGFAHIASVVPQAVPLTEYNARHFYSEVIRDCLTAHGFSEVITSSFRAHDEIPLQSSLASDKSFLRSNLRVNLVEVLDKNAGLTDLLGTKDTRVFEIGTVFKKTDSGILEAVMVAFGVRVRASGYSGKEDAIVNVALAALGDALGLTVPATASAGVVEFDLSALLARLPVPTAYRVVPSAPTLTYRSFSVYPTISRDIAFWAPEGLSVAAVEDLIAQEAGPLRARTTFVDEFHKEGRVSYAFRVVFQAPDRTLTDADVEAPMARLYEAMTALGCEVR